MEDLEAHLSHQAELLPRFIVDIREKPVPPEILDLRVWRFEHRLDPLTGRKMTKHEIDLCMGERRYRAAGSR